MGKDSSKSQGEKSLGFHKRKHEEHSESQLALEELCSPPLPEIVTKSSASEEAITKTSFKMSAMEGTITKYSAKISATRLALEELRSSLARDSHKDFRIGRGNHKVFVKDAALEGESTKIAAKMSAVDEAFTKNSAKISAMQEKVKEIPVLQEKLKMIPKLHEHANKLKRARELQEFYASKKLEQNYRTSAL